MDTALLERELTWMTPYEAYLEGQDILDDDASVEKIARKSRLYTLVTASSTKRGVMES